MTNGEETIVQAIDKENYELRQELAEAKALLKEAVNSLYYNYHYASKAEIRLCYCDKCLNSADCSKDIDKCKFVWWKRDELLKLFKED